MTPRTATRIQAAGLLVSLLVSIAIGARADTPGWSPVSWGVFFLVFMVFVGGPIALWLEWRVTRGWTRPNPHVAPRLQIEERLAPHRVHAPE